MFFAVAPTYTQLAPGGRVAGSSTQAQVTNYPAGTQQGQTAPPPTGAVWSGGSAPWTGVQTPTPSQPTNQQPANAGGAAQGEEFSEVFRMLDNTAGEFSDLSGMFNNFGQE